MKIYLDDTRKPADSFKQMREQVYLENDWIEVLRYNDFVSVIEEIIKDDKFEEIELISFDHDLADEHYHKAMLLANHDIYNALYPTFKEKTGLECAKFLIETCMDTGYDLPPFKIHTQNPVGHKNLTGLLENFKKHQGK